MLELRKEPVNHEVVKKLQELSFASRVEDIGSYFKGPDVVTNVCQKYPFLQLEQQVKFVVLYLPVTLEQFAVSENLQ